MQPPPIEDSWWWLGGGLAFAAGGAAVAVWAQPWRDKSEVSGRIAWAFALFDGFVGASLVHQMTKRTLSLPPATSQEALLLYAGPIALTAAIITALPRTPGWLAWVVRVVMLLLVPAAATLTLIRNAWTTGEAAQNVLAGAGATGVVWFAMDRLTQRDARPISWWALVVASIAAGGTILASGSIVLGQFALTLAASLIGVGAGGLLFGVAASQRAGVLTAAALLSALLMQSVFLSELTIARALLLGAAPMGAWVTQIPAIRKMSAWKAVLIGCMASGAIAAIAMAPAVLAAQEAADSSGY